ncbi:hypothetical protein MNBD_ALPHA12-1626, partial [hydrothermal vent metagenome]
RIYPGRKAAPVIAARDVLVKALPLPPEPGRDVSITFLSPTDTTGGNPLAEPHKLLTRLLRRVDGISRWNGMALTNEAGRALAAHIRTLGFDTGGLRPGAYSSSNAHRQKRVKTTITGALVLSGNIAPIWPLLAMGERCHLGRGAVEGLGAFSLSG